MKLSIIVPVYKDVKFLEKYLERMAKVDSKNYEIVFIVDTNNQGVLEVIEKGITNLKGDHKLIYNSKRTGRANAIDLGISSATGEYLIVQSLSNRFDESFVTELTTEAENKGSDIIEFRPHIVSPLKFKPKLRKNFLKPVDITNNKSVIAYSYPLIFNKIFRTEIAKQSVQHKTISKRINNRLSIDLLYKIFANSKTYSTISISPIKSNFDISKGFNPLEVSREWDQISSSDFYKPFTQELKYVRYFNGLILIPAYIKIMKNSVLQSKFDKRFLAAFPKNDDFFTLNKYYLSSTKEAGIMREYKNKNSSKAYKEL